MNELLQPLLCCFSIGFLLFIFMALASPLESLSWWSGWSKRQVAPPPPEPPPITSNASYFVVYMTAIGVISTELSRREAGFLDLLQAETPDAVIISDVYPFSVTNNPLNGERQLAWVWQRLHESRMRRKASFLAALIFVRNMLQVGVSGDPRYGPIYNAGVARETVLSLLRRGYRPGSGKPIIILGWSGGGQIAAGVVPYVRRALDAPVYIVSIGGVIADEPGVAYAEHTLHLQGSRDKFPTYGGYLYPGRWPISRHSAWNQALHDGRITILDPGPMRHTGRDDYFDYKARLPNGRSHVEQTAFLIGQFIRQQKPATPH